MTDSLQESCERPLTVAVRAVRWTPATGPERASCLVAAEVSLTIAANGRELVTLQTAPRSLRELTVGYLFTAGIIQTASQVLNWQCDPQNWRVDATIISSPRFSPAEKQIAPTEYSEDAGNLYIDDGCQSGQPVPALSVSARTVALAGQWITGCSEVFRESGGVHAAGLFDPVYGPLFFYEDVARHNALDKAIGRALLDTLDLSRLLLVRTGRTSSEIVQKARRTGLTILIARGAPTDQAVILARNSGMTLVGFAREEGFMVYTHPARILM